MEKHKNITIFENKRRIKLLKEFRELIFSYFFKEGKNQKIRQDINKYIPIINDIIIASGIDTSIILYHPPITGRPPVIVNYLDILFSKEYKIDVYGVIDLINKSLGVYERNKKRSILNTINPFFWIIMILENILEYFFGFIGRAGFNQKKFEESYLAKIIKLIFYLIPFLVALITLWEKISLYLRR